MSFNNDPFQLGTFDQILHRSEGKAKREKQFFISTKIEARNSKTLEEENVATPTYINLDLEFSSHDSNAEISKLIATMGRRKLSFEVDTKSMKIGFLSWNKKNFIMNMPNFMDTVGRRDFAKNWTAYLSIIPHFLEAGKTIDKKEFDLSKEETKEIKNFIELLINSLLDFHKYSFATSAIRTKPLRTYTPGIESHDGEGSHVPFEIAKMYRSRNKKVWNGFKAAIEKYGRSSEMFKKISVNAFGNTVSDPFQIQFSNGGPNTNIVDLGYGTSQVLPILHGVSTSKPGSTFLIQQPEVHLHPRAQAALGTYFVDSYINEQREFVLETHSDFLLDRIRHSIFEGKIEAKDVSILFFKRSKLKNTIIEIQLDKNGDPTNAPQSYRSFFLEEQMNLLGI